MLSNEKLLVLIEKREKFSNLRQRAINQGICPDDGFDLVCKGNWSIHLECPKCHKKYSVSPIRNLREL